jgi:interferon gamma-inducible protein 30
MTGQLWNAFNQISSIMSLNVVPYGNAKETWRNETKLWQFTCQHGPDECYGNLLHTCFMYFYPNPADHLSYIHCMEASGHDIRNASLECASEQRVSLDATTKCMQSRLGNSLQHNNALKTEQLSPSHNYVPWVNSKQVKFYLRISI